MFSLENSAVSNEPQNVAFIIIAIVIIPTRWIPKISYLPIRDLVFLPDIFCEMFYMYSG